MTRLTWDVVGERLYETGVDRTVLYVDSNAGVAWSGLVSVDESPSGGGARPRYLDGVKYLNLSEREEFQATIEAFYSPPDFDVCDGLAFVRQGLYAAQQRRKTFSLSYRTKIGNDTNGSAHGYKIHIIYNALADPTQRSYESISDSPEVPMLSWSITTKPVFIPGIGYSSHLVVDTTTATPYSIQTLENILYGDDEELPRLPTPEELSDLFEDSAPLTVTDLGSDEFSISGSGFAVNFLDDGEWQITGDTVDVIDEDETEITSE